MRFKSVIVEDGVAAKTMAAYIDLNPVRAGMVEDPAEYRWSSYGEAMGGGAKGNGKKARAGLVRALRAHKGGEADAALWANDVSREYRKILLSGAEGKTAERVGRDGKTVVKTLRKGMKAADAEREKAQRWRDFAREDAALPGALFHGRRGDRQPAFRERGVCERPGALRAEAQGRGEEIARGCRAGGRGVVEREGFEEIHPLGRPGHWKGQPMSPSFG